MPRWTVLAPMATLLVALASCHGEGSSGARASVDGDEAAQVRVAYAAARRAQGATDPRYALREVEQGVFLAEPPGTTARAELGASGMTVHREGETWRATFTTARYGCAEALAPVEDGPARRSASNRVERRSSAGGVPLVEWVEQGPLGLERGFVLAESPCPSAKELVLEERIDDLDVVPRSDRRGVDLRDAAGVVRVHYTDLSATDARGAALPTRMEAMPGGVALHVDARAATFPVTVDPLAWFQIQKVVATGGGTDDVFGTALRLSGTTAIVGAEGATANGKSEAGAAYVFVRSASGWVEQQALFANDGAPGLLFGFSVALDGDTAVVGSPGNFADNGAAYVFVRSGSQWTQQQKIVPEAPASFFAGVLAMSGSTILIGAPDVGPIGPVETTGTVFVYTASGGSWSLQQSIQSSDEVTGDDFGGALEILGNTLMVGAPGATIGSSANQGAAYVFLQSGSTFMQQQKLVAGDGAAGDHFGASFALSGTTALIGAITATIGGNASQGAAYTFTQAGGTFTEQQKLVASDGVAGDQFGHSVALAGGVALVSAVPDVSIQQSQPPGHVYAFALTGSTWTQTQKLGAGDPVDNDRFGLGLATDGTEALVGAPGVTDAPNPDQGAMYVEELLSTAASSCSAGAECGSGFCVDGVCCDSACELQCQACDIPGMTGTCSPVSGPPHGARTPCISVGPLCGGRCDGKVTAACSYLQPGTSCGTTCSGNQETADTCDGEGTCVLGKPAACRNNLRCDAMTGACNTTCTTDAECVGGYVCAGGACSPGAACLDGHTSQGPDGTQDCGAFGCSSTTGGCNTVCATVDDCSAPNVCDDTGACVAPPDTSDGAGGGCAVGAARDDPSPASGLALSCLAFALGLRSRPSRPRRERSRPGSGP